MLRAAAEGPSWDKRMAARPAALRAPLSVGESAEGPSLCLRRVADVTELLTVYGQLREQVRAMCGEELTWTDFLLRAVAMALSELPQANRAVRGASVIQAPTINVGVAANAADGPSVAVIEEADLLSMVDLVRRRAAAIRGAGQRHLVCPIALLDLSHCPVDECLASRYLGSCSVLVAGGIGARPAVFQQELSVRQTQQLVLAIDPRVVDAADAAVFLGRVADWLGRPLLLIWGKPS